MIRQIQGGTGNLFAGVNAANDLFPLLGYLNTSLGAIDVNGNVGEQSLGDAFGQLNIPTGLKQNHLYTGEYWDQDAQLLYLRARWYDPRIGRFVSADPFQGSQKDSRSLNRYAYAHGDPVHNTDPGGNFAGEIGFAVAAIAILTVIAVNTQSPNQVIAGTPGKFGIADSIMAQEITHDVPDEAFDRMMAAQIKAIPKTHTCVCSNPPSSHPTPEPAPRV